MYKVLSVTSLLLLSSILSGCFGSKTSLSTLRMDKPEVSSNRYQTNLKVGLGMRQEVNLTSSDDSDKWVSDLSAISLDSEVKKNELSPFINLAVVVAPKLELSLGSLEDSKLGVKYQFSGQDAENADSGNFSQAATFAISLFKGSNNQISTSKTEVFFDDTESPVDYDVQTQENYNQKTFSIDVAYILGYRFSKRQMIYGGPFFIWSSLKGEQLFSVTRTANGNTSESSTEQRILDLDSNGNMLGVSLAYEFLFNNGIFLTTEYSVGKMKWHNDSASTSALNFVVGYNF